MEMTKDLLLKYLENLRKALQSFDFSSIENVIFYNLESFYTFINQLRVDIEGAGYSVSFIMESISPYIPLVLTEKNLDVFLALSDAPDVESEKIQDSLLDTSKVDFINAIRNAKSEHEWNRIITLCTSMWNSQNCVHIDL